MTFVVMLSSDIKITLAIISIKLFISSWTFEPFLYEFRWKFSQMLIKNDRINRLYLISMQKN